MSDACCHLPLLVQFRAAIVFYRYSPTLTGIVGQQLFVCLWLYFAGE